MFREFNPVSAFPRGEPLQLGIPGTFKHARGAPVRIKESASLIFQLKK